MINDIEVEADNKRVFAIENLSAKTEEAKFLNWWSLNKIKYPHLASFARKYLFVLSSSVYSEKLFLKLVILYEQTRNHLLPNTGERLLFIHKNWNSFFVV